MSIFIIFLSKSLNISENKIYVLGIDKSKEMIQRAKKYESKFLNFFTAFIIWYIISPLPAPSSTMLNFFGHPKFSQNEIIQIAIISENIIDIFGEVIKSPLEPMGLPFM